MNELCLVNREPSPRLQNQYEYQEDKDQSTDGEKDDNKDDEEEELQSVNGEKHGYNYDDEDEDAGKEYDLGLHLLVIQAMEEGHLRERKRRSHTARCLYLIGKAILA
ncbi:hypothetical protein FQN57_004553 [Myotisia sp. PD_48]|nr:hypothetical protein FQN57_004553 [Myotisia sp. PD_48]